MAQPKRIGVTSAVLKALPTRRPRQQPLADGQVWRMAEANLKVDMVGKLLVHYKLAKPHVVRVTSSCGSIKAVEKFLKAKKAVLV